MHGAEHVSEHLLEEFALRDCGAGANDRLVYEHVFTCPFCQDRLYEMCEFVAFQRALPGETAGQVRFRHSVDRGTLFLVVDGSDAYGWQARVLGPGLDLCRCFLRGVPAKAWLESWFATAFPGHRCGSGCGAGWQ
jgi:hypothetical protein